MKEAPFIHERALVETDAIGEGTRIWAFAHVLKNVHIGSHCNIGDHAFIESGVSIGNNVTIKNGVCIWQHVHVADNVFLGPNAVLTNDLTPRSRDTDWTPVSPTVYFRPQRSQVAFNWGSGFSDRAQKHTQPPCRAGFP